MSIMIFIDWIYGAAAAQDARGLNSSTEIVSAQNDPSRIWDHLLQLRQYPPVPQQKTVNDFIKTQARDMPRYLKAFNELKDAKYGYYQTLKDLSLDEPKDEVAVESMIIDSIKSLSVFYEHRSLVEIYQSSIILSATRNGFRKPTNHKSPIEILDELFSFELRLFSALRDYYVSRFLNGMSAQDLFKREASLQKFQCVLRKTEEEKFPHSIYILIEHMRLYPTLMDVFCGKSSRGIKFSQELRNREKKEILDVNFEEKGTVNFNLHQMDWERWNPIMQLLDGGNLRYAFTCYFGFGQQRTNLLNEIERREFVEGEGLIPPKEHAKAIVELVDAEREASKAALDFHRKHFENRVCGEYRSRSERWRERTQHKLRRLLKLMENVEKEDDAEELVSEDELTSASDDDSDFEEEYEEYEPSIEDDDPDAALIDVLYAQKSAKDAYETWYADNERQEKAKSEGKHKRRGQRMQNPNAGPAASSGEGGGGGATVPLQTHSMKSSDVKQKLMFRPDVFVEDEEARSKLRQVIIEFSKNKGAEYKALEDLCRKLSIGEFEVGVTNQSAAIKKGKLQKNGGSHRKLAIKQNGKAIKVPDPLAGVFETHETSGVLGYKIRKRVVDFAVQYYAQITGQKDYLRVFVKEGLALKGRLEE